MLAKVNHEEALRQKAALRRAQKKLNAIGIHRAKNRKWKGMTHITDAYSQLDELLNGSSVHLERRRIFTTAFEKPIHYKKVLTITGATAARTHESNRTCLKGHSIDEKIMDCLQIAFTLNTDDPDGEYPDHRHFLEQGWVGSESAIARRYADSDRGHVLGRLWDGAYAHDFTSHLAGNWCAKDMVLTFVAQDRRNPLFFGGKEVSVSYFGAIRKSIKEIKAAIGAAIMGHLEGDKNIAMSGEVYVK